MKRYLAPVLAALVIGACAHKEEAPVAPAAPPPPPTQAHAVLKAAKGSKIAGTIHFTEANGEITIQTDVSGLKKGSVHGFHIHEVGTCEGDFSSAGGHFNPTNHKHGAPTAAEKHVGDLGNVKADKKGKLNTSITLKAPLNGPEGIIGKSIVIHKGKDDLKSQPAGNSGPREACGVIEAM